MALKIDNQIQPSIPDVREYRVSTNSKQLSRGLNQRNNRRSMSVSRVSYMHTQYTYIVGKYKNSKTDCFLSISNARTCKLDRFRQQKTKKKPTIDLFLSKKTTYHHTNV